MKVKFEIETEPRTVELVNAFLYKFYSQHYKEGNEDKENEDIKRLEDFRKNMIGGFLQTSNPEFSESIESVFPPLPF